MADKLVVVTDRKLSEYHELNKQQIKKKIDSAIQELPESTKSGKIEEMNQENVFEIYGGKAPIPEEEAR